MKSERDINELMQQLHRKADPDLDERVHHAIEAAPAGPQTTTTSKTDRRSMIAPFVKLVAAAVIVLAVLLGLNVIETPSTGGVAWAQVPQNVASADAFIFSLTIRLAGSEPVNAAESIAPQWVFYMSQEYGFRMDIRSDDNVVSWYVGPKADKLITVIPAEKTWFESPLPEGRAGGMPEGYRDPNDYVRRFMERPYKVLGRSTIDGIEVEGIEVTNPPTDGQPLEDSVGRMWVDVTTELPVRIEIEGTADGRPVQWLMNFQWSEAVDSTLFEPNIPANYIGPLQ